jgi:hypothetical protein
VPVPTDVLHALREWQEKTTWPDHDPRNQEPEIETQDAINAIQW